MDIKITTSKVSKLPFSGMVQSNSPAIKYAVDYAAEYASANELKQFYNTIKAVKSDASMNLLSVECEKVHRDGGVKKSWVTRYGDYIEVIPFVRGDKYEKRDVFNSIIRFGKTVFGDTIVNKHNKQVEEAYIAKITSMSYINKAKELIEKANKLQEMANNVFFDV